MVSHTTKSPEYIFRETFPDERSGWKKRYYKTVCVCFFLRVQGKVFLDYLNGKEMNWGLEERVWRWTAGLGSEGQSRRSGEQTNTRRALCQRDHLHWVCNLTFRRFSSALLTTAGPESIDRKKSWIESTLYKGQWSPEAGEMLASGHLGRGDAGGGTPHFRPSHQ